MDKNGIAYDDTTKELNNSIMDFYQKNIVDVEMVTYETNMSYHRNIEYWEEKEPWFSAAVVDKNYAPLGEYASTNPVFVTN